MAEVELLLACRGSGPEHGLARARRGGAGWVIELLAEQAQLSALARHPLLPVVYGVAGQQEGRILGWRVAQRPTLLFDESSGGAQPCHLAVAPDGRLLVAVNYDSAVITAWPLRTDGGLAGAPVLRQLVGDGPDPDRQAQAHPHQVVFGPGYVIVVDLGADLIRLFAADAQLPPLGEVPTPPGSGPRHLVVLADGRVAVAAELSAEILLGRLDPQDPDWARHPSGHPSGHPCGHPTEHPGHPGERDVRTYPSEIVRHPSLPLVYLANRGRDTIATFAIGEAGPTLLAEIPAGVAWTQHLLVCADELLVAGERSDQLAVFALRDGLPSTGPNAVPGPVPCPAPCWITLDPTTSL